MDGLLGVAGMIIISDGLEWIGSFPHSPKFPTFSTSKITATSGSRDAYDTFLRPHVYSTCGRPRGALNQTYPAVAYRNILPKSILSSGFLSTSWWMQWILFLYVYIHTLTYLLNCIHKQTLFRASDTKKHDLCNGSILYMNYYVYNIH